MKKKYDEHEKTFAYLQRHTGIELSKDDLFRLSWKTYHILDILKIEVGFHMCIFKDYLHIKDTTLSASRVTNSKIRYFGLYS